MYVRNEKTAECTRHKQIKKTHEVDELLLDLDERVLDANIEPFGGSGRPSGERVAILLNFRFQGLFFRQEASTWLLFPGAVVFHTEAERCAPQESSRQQQPQEGGSFCVPVALQTINTRRGLSLPARHVCGFRSRVGSLRGRQALGAALRPL